MSYGDEGVNRTDYPEAVWFTSRLNDIPSALERG